jgi:hypothetical protein
VEKTIGCDIFVLVGGLVPYSVKAVIKNKEMRGVFIRKNRYIPPRYLLAACLR